MLTRHDVSHFRYFGILLAILLLAAGLPACYLEEPCSLYDLYAPTDLRPNDYRNPLADLNQRFNWSYPEGCNPDSFVVEVGDYYFSDIVYITEVDGSDRSVDLGPFVSGRYYAWRVKAVAEGEEGEPAKGIFIIGSFCSEADRASFTPPILLSPPDGQVISDTVTYSHSDGSTSVNLHWCTEWENTMSCLPSEGFVYEFAADRDFHEVIGYFDRQLRTYECIWMAWPHLGDPEIQDCDRIYWRVLVGEIRPEGDLYANIYAVSGTRSFIVNTTGTYCMPDLGLIVTAIPWIDLPLPTAPSGPPTAIPLVEANCRSGPAMDYPLLSILLAGQQFEIRGRNQSGGYWMVFDPAIQKSCWVFGDLVEETGDTSGVPIVQAEPLLPTPTDTPVTPFNCAQYTGLTCEADDHPCKWTGNVCVNE